MEIIGSAPHAALKRTAIESAGATSKVQQILHSLQVLQVGRVGKLRRIEGPRKASSQTPGELAMRFPAR
jgi:hypothetical protein